MTRWLVLVLLGCSGGGSDDPTGTGVPTAPTSPGPPTFEGTLLTETQSLHGPAGAKRFGVGFAVGDLDGDGRDEVLAGDSVDNEVVAWNGAEGQVGANPEALQLTLLTGLGYNAQPPVLAVGDFDGDGQDDLVSGQGFTGPGSNAVRFGPLAGQVSGAPDAELIFGTPWAVGDLSGGGGDELMVAPDSVARVYADGDFTAPWLQVDLGTRAEVGASGDTDGDGVPELLLANPGLKGRAWLFDPTAGDLGPDDAVATFVGLEFWQRLGHAAVLADYDGDGLDDVVLSAPSDLANGVVPSRVVVFPTPAGAYTVDDAPITWLDDSRDDHIGYGLAAADLDGDGAAELLVGAPRISVVDTIAGGMLLLPGGATGVQSLDEVSDRYLGLDFQDQIGTTVAFADLDGDGVPEAISNAPDASLNDPALDKVGALFWVSVP